MAVESLYEAIHGYTFVDETLRDLAMAVESLYEDNVCRKDIKNNAVDSVHNHVANIHIQDDKVS
jgi:hypothetical protein